MRFGGSKGLLLLMSEEQERRHPGKDIILRDSMVKSYASEEYANDPSMITLDFVQYSTPIRLGASVSSEPMSIMQHRGVPEEVFVRLQQLVLEAIGQDLSPVPVMTGDGIVESEEEALVRLRRNVYVRGGVGQDREKRRMASNGISMKVAGFERRGKKSEEEMQEVDEDEDLEGSVVTLESDLSASTASSAAPAHVGINGLTGLPESPSEA